MLARVSRRLAGSAAAVLGLMAVLSVSTASAQASPVAGNWKGTFISDGPSGEMSMNFWQEGGTWNVETGLMAEGAPPADGAARELKIEGSTFSFAQLFGEYDVLMKGTVEGDTLKGTIEAYQGGSLVGTGSFTLQRQP
jgi:hypothetical protein